MVNKKSLKLSIYSGKYLRLLTTMHPGISKLKIKLINNELSEISAHYSILGNENYILRFPKLVEFTVDDHPLKIKNKVELILLKECLLIQKNISSIINDEYLLDFGKGFPVVCAGPGTIKTFRRNYFYRLYEVFFNLEWLYKFANNKEKTKNEIITYQSVLKILKKYYIRIPIEVENIMNRVMKNVKSNRIKKL